MVVRRVVITDGKLFDKSRANYGNIPKNSNIVEQYEFAIDEWYQKTWWENTLKLVEEMLASYMNYSGLKVPFRRAYGNCERYFRPCALTAHCTSSSFQDLYQLGYEQKVYDKESATHIPLVDYRKSIFGEQ